MLGILFRRTSNLWRLADRDMRVSILMDHGRGVDKLCREGESLDLGVVVGLRCRGCGILEFGWVGLVE